MALPANTKSITKQAGYIGHDFLCIATYLPVDNAQEQGHHHVHHQTHLDSKLKDYGIV